MNYYAHTSGKDQSDWQLIKDHLNQTSRIASGFGVGTAFNDLAKIAALLHDIGKYSTAFQERLKGSPQPVDHSTAGAKEAHRLFKDTPTRQYMGDLLAYCIAGHHSGLPDYGSAVDLAQDGTLLARLKKILPDYSAYAQEIQISSSDLPARLVIRPIPQYLGFSMAFLTRMVYSALVDADFLETEQTMRPGGTVRGAYPDILALCDTYNQFLHRFDHPTQPINQKRTEILNVCLERAADPPGFFTLTVPTGGGKTYASMAFALNHAHDHGLKRIIYVIPYTTIIEQNANVFKAQLGDENILEHHSNFNWDSIQSEKSVEASDDKDVTTTDKLKWAAENWDIPIVVTTNVQFFESLYANRSSRCRKIHNIAQSVVIFDEAQMLPRDFIKPCLYAAAELVNNYNATVVFCTATQPAVETFLPAGSSVREIIPDPQALYRFFRRVRVRNAGTLSDEELAQRINDRPQMLCIVNTRKHARELFGSLKPEGRFHLSTLMCPVHRQQVIAEMKECLKHGQPCRVVSTQIMEAGIDVDFPVGYRALAGLDSIIQAAGRVNREMKQTEGELWVFEPDSPTTRRVPKAIQQCGDVARGILRQYADDPICLEAVEAYYQQLYDLQNDHAFDNKRILDYFPNAREPIFQFETAAREFKLIEENTESVIIPYDEDAVKLLEQLRFSQYPCSLLRKLQRYTVNIYDPEFQALQNSGAIDWINDTYAVLKDETSYDKETGLVVPETTRGTAIFL